MERLKKQQAVLRVLLALSTMGATAYSVSVGGCLQTAARNINPCGTIVDCDPIEWDLMFHDFPDYDTDPTCVIPGLCGNQWPPTGTNTGA